MTLLIFLLAGLLLAYLLIDYLQSARKDRIRERLMAGVYDTEEQDVSLWADAADLLQVEAIRNLVYSSVLTRKLGLNIKRAGLPVSLMQGILIVVFGAVIPAVVAYLYWKNLTAVIIGFFTIPLLFWIIAAALAARRQTKLESQLPALITSLLTTMRAGGTPVQALQAAAKNSPSPMRDSIAEVLNQIQIGRPPVVAWQEWANFWDTRGSKLLSTGIRLKWDSGGQMTTILEHILETLEFRKRMELRVSTLTAQAKLSAWVLSALPIALAILTYSYRPDLFNTMLNDERGNYMLIYVGVSTLIGFFWLRKIAKLRG